VSRVPPARPGRWLTELARSHDVAGRDRMAIGLGDPAREIVATP